MHLLKFDALAEPQRSDITLCEYQNEEVPPYAILSHRWGPIHEEVSYTDFKKQKDIAIQKKGYKKIEQCCKLAFRDGLTHLWIDTCCINKESSAELSEAINSMFEWYKGSAVCYAYLDDVPNPSIEDITRATSSFRGSQWFTRGWTLQEMIAPTDVIFFSADWVRLGRKHHLSGILMEITTVSEEVLLNPSGTLDNICVSQKMSWASNRRTTRIEDRAYSLIGLFNVSLPIVYGERSRAFLRLQEAIIKQRFDHSIFAWQLKESFSSLLADSPDAFANSANIRAMTLNEFSALFQLRQLYDYMAAVQLDYTMTNLGIHIYFPRQKLKSPKSLYIAYLACYFTGTQTPIFIYLRRYYNGPEGYFVRTRRSSASMGCGIKSIMQSNMERYTAQPKLLIANVDPFSSKFMRHVVLDDLAAQRSSHKGIAGVYHINLSFQGRLSALYPMADHLEDNRLTIETTTEAVSIAVIRLSESCIAHLVLAVKSNELIIHLDAKENVSGHPFLTSDAQLICQSIYNKFRACPTIPCVKATIGYDKFKADDSCEMVSVSQETYFDSELNRKVFSLWLKKGRMKELAALGNRPPMVVPPPWNYSLGELLRSCRPLFERLPPIEAEYDPYLSQNGRQNYVSEHALEQSPGYNLGQTSGTADGGRHGTLEGNTRSGVDTSKLNPLKMMTAATSPCTSSSSMLLREFEDSYWFNYGYVAGYTKAYVKACDSRHKQQQREPGYAHGYSIAYAAAWKASYTVGHDSNYALAHGADLPEERSGAVAAYAKGYTAGFPAGYAFGKCTAGSGGVAENAGSSSSVGDFVNDVFGDSDRPAGATQQRIVKGATSMGLKLLGKAIDANII